jgi:hypothetical protein
MTQQESGAAQSRFGAGLFDMRRLPTDTLLHLRDALHGEYELSVIVRRILQERGADL